MSEFGLGQSVFRDFVTPGDSGSGAHAPAKSAIRDALTELEVNTADTRAAITGGSDNIPAVVAYIRTAGYATVGDGGGGLYKRVGAEPSHAGKMQSPDGTWWELVPEPWGVSVHQFGAKGDDATDDTAAIQNTIDYANAEGQTIWLHRGKTYRVTNLSMNSVQNFAMRTTSSMPRKDASAATALAYHGTAGSTLLYMEGVLMALIEGIVFKYGSAAPDAYIKTDNETGFGTSTIRLDNVLFFGNGKADGSIGFDMGPNSSANNADHDWGRVEFRSIQTGWRFRHNQNVGYHVSYLRGVSCGTLVDIVEGGGLKISTLNCTNNDMDVNMDVGGNNVGHLTIDNALAEQAPANADAQFLNVGGTAEPCTVVLNNPKVQSGYSGQFMRIQSGATVIVNGGLLNGSEILISGLEDEGDALLLMQGTKFGGTFTTNDFGYYRHASPKVGLTASVASNDPFGGAVTRTSGAETLGHDNEKMKAGTKRYFEMPLARAGGSVVQRHIPSNAEVTGIDVVIENVGSATGSDEVEIRVGGTAGTVGTLIVGTAGPRHFGWAANDLDAGDTDTRVLGSTAVLAALDTTQTVFSVITAGTAANVQSATAHLIVEYIVRSVKATGLDS